MRVSAQIEVAAPPEDVWEFIVDPARYLHFMAGMTRWEVDGDQATGMGARYRMLMRVGSAEVGGLVEIVEWDEGCDLAWTSVTGIDQRGRWRLRAPARRAHPRRAAAEPTASRAPGILGLGRRAASPRRPCAGTCAARCSSSSARSSTSACAAQAAQRRTARGVTRCWR